MKEFVELTDQDIENWYKYQKANDIRIELRDSAFATIERDKNGKLAFHLKDEDLETFGTDQVAFTINRYMRPPSEPYSGLWVTFFKVVYNWCIQNRLANKLELI